MRLRYVIDCDHSRCNLPVADRAWAPCVADSMSSLQSNPSEHQSATNPVDANSGAANAVGALAIGFEPCQWQLLTGRDWIKQCNFCALGDFHLSFMQAVRSVCAGGAKSTQPFKRSQSVGSVSSDAFSARPRRLSAGACDTSALLWLMGRVCVPSLLGWRPVSASLEARSGT